MLTEEIKSLLIPLGFDFGIVLFLFVLCVFVVSEVKSLKDLKWWMALPFASTIYKLAKVRDRLIELSSMSEFGSAFTEALSYAFISALVFFIVIASVIVFTDVIMHLVDKYLLSDDKKENESFDPEEELDKLTKDYKELNARKEELLKSIELAKADNAKLIKTIDAKIENVNALFTGKEIKATKRSSKKKNDK